MATVAHSTELARSLDLGSAWNAPDDRVAASFHVLYGPALRRVRGGDTVLRGLPFRLGSAGNEPRWLLIDKEVEIDLADADATHLVLLHFCDAWRDEADARPAGVPLGWVVPVGEPLVDVSVLFDDGKSKDLTLRRRFEVNEGIIGWGSTAFLATPHRTQSPIDWLGPHRRQ